MKKRSMISVTLAAMFLLAGIVFAFPATALADSWDNDPNNYSYSDIDSSTTEVIGYLGSSTLIEIPAVSSAGKTVVGIGDSLFDSKGITGVRIPASVTKIGNRAFVNCTSLTDVEFLGTSQLQEIGNSAFQNTGIASVTIPAGVNKLGAGVFFSCASLSSVTFSGTSLSEIGAQDFTNCTGLKGITLPSSITKIGAGAFRSSGLISIAVPDGVTDIDGNDTLSDGGAFQGCGSLQSVTFGPGSQLQTIGDYVFDDCGILGGIAMPSGVTSIGKEAFNQCTLLGSASGGSVNIPSGVASIGESTFGYCTSLQSVVIPAGVTAIGDYAFQNDTALVSVTFGPGTEMLGSVGAQAFVLCTSLSGITLPDTVNTIGAEAFGVCTNITSFTIPAGVTEISDWAFNGMGITNITIPASITKIDQGAFYSCTDLKAVTFEAGSQLTAIGDEAFSHCNGLTGVTLPNGLNSLGTKAFYYDTSLKSVTIPASLGSIPDYAFQQTGLTSLTLPEGVALVGSNAFSYCNSLTSISLPGSLSGIGDYAFAHDNNLSDISLSEGLDSIGVSAFDSDICPDFSDIMIPSTVTSIKDNAFINCTNLKRFYIKSKIAAFSGIHIFDGTGLNDDASCGIYGYVGSTAETYANTNGINFHAGSVLLKFDSNGGSAVNDQIITSGSSGTKPYPDPIKAGYKLENWYTDPLFAPGSVWDFTGSITSDTTLYAKWVTAYTLTYDGNNNTSGSAPIDYDIYTVGDNAFVQGNPYSLARTGYAAFLNWNTQPDGQGTDYYGGNTLVMPANDVTLYAKWTANTYTVAYNANGGTGTTASSSHTYDVSKALTANVFSRTGYTFAGWAASQTGTAAYSDKQNVVNLTAVNGATVTLYAKWTANACTVTFNDQNGNSSGQTAYYGGLITKPADPARAGYAFGGWYKEAACQNAWDFNAETVTVSITLYAKWMINAYTVSFNSQGGSAVQSQAVTYGNTATRPTDPSLAGYTFGGWYKEAACINVWNFNTDIVNGNTTIYAKWDKSYPANKLPSKVNTGTEIAVIPSSVPRGYTLQSVTYTSSNSSVASITPNGAVTFLAGGKATITIKIVSQTVDKRGRVRTRITTIRKKITVNQPVASIMLNQTNVTIAKKSRMKLTPSIIPGTASNKKVKWTSSNRKVASVSSSGVVIGRAAGTAVITCIAKDGSNVSASCTVIVTPIYPSKIKLSRTVLTVRTGRTASLRAAITPRNTDFKTVAWASSNTSIATVDSRGRIKGIAPGIVTITATTSNGLNAACTVTVK